MYPANMPRESAAMTLTIIPAIAPPLKFNDPLEFVCIVDGDAVDKEAADVIFEEVIVAELIKELREDDIEDGLEDELVDVYPGIKFLLAISQRISCNITYSVQQKPYSRIVTQAGRLAPGMIPEDELGSDWQYIFVIPIISYKKASPTGYKFASNFQKMYRCKHPVCVSHCRIQFMRYVESINNYDSKSCEYCRSEIGIQRPVEFQCCDNEQACGGSDDDKRTPQKPEKT
ncbi:hypothetical protein AOQ84DRAFT_366963 [Glonium stellatum]|uniref:Uncharacterized protein n=1 Tax=Glonium stellatum TaxID=574774 RepID=A0A8E2JPU8_9PEZI|nr:hypothetical protein AOQ84DRAFT_366963 [Glonium stellatum]